MSANEKIKEGDLVGSAGKRQPGFGLTAKTIKACGNGQGLLQMDFCGRSFLLKQHPRRSGTLLNINNYPFT